MRAGLLARYLASTGHDVTWWTSTFDHTQKVHLFDTDTILRLNDGVELRALRGLGYRRNISLQRIRDHRMVARAFEREAPSAPRPDIILASYPTIELAGAAVRFGARFGVPCVIDIRDLWPDLYSESLPRWMRRLAAPALALARLQARRVCGGADAIISNARSFVDWGLRLAGRVSRPGDRHFPFGYALPAVAPERREQARQFWRERGIEAGGAQLIGCYFGAIGHQSDFGCVVEAAEILRRQGANVRIVICGTGERLEELRGLAGDNPALLFPGWIGQPEIAALMEAAHFGIAPYRNNVGFVDNMPNKPIEYMAGGLAVVTCVSGYLRDFIAEHECGFHYAAGDALALAGLIAGLDGDRPRLRRAGANARQAYEKHFDADVVHGRLGDYLATMARAGKSRAAAL